ncbi:AAA family ATPase [Listeria seeligeri]|uniref:UvrD-helicase domain-containing protein n=1 Tax=Listeria seeligeri TaxID=1640 RepID=UPI00188963A1|nr:UvrD-helicase domain-containing protein [Listeria seeligeri]MBF2599170.1 AAA family ATPase [Listeria seeligeri]
MDKRIILAVAGSGKTYHICNELDPAKRNLIIAFTNQNITNIKGELIKIYGDIPKNTRVMTFAKFVYNFYLLPYESLIQEQFLVTNLISDGVYMLDSPPMRLKKKNGETFPNRNYVKQEKFGHYAKFINKFKYRYYVDKFSKLVLKTKKLDQKGTDNVGFFFDKLYIDEFQDFREDDYRLLEKLIKRFNRVLLVGDYYQHSVNGKNNSGKPINKNMNYSEYKALLDKLGLDVDNISLSKSKRCPANVCDFVSNKLSISIESDSKFAGEGDVIFIQNCEKAISILRDSTIKKLVFNGADKYRFEAINWGYSKGDTYSNTCIILTSDFENIEKDDAKCKSESTLNKLYVALTRTKGNVYMLKKSIFDQIKEDYLQ